MARLSSGNNLARPGEFGKSRSFVIEANGCVIKRPDIFRPCSILRPRGGTRRIVAT
jgi:hypothetical protein